MTVLDLHRANKRIEELEGKLGEESLKVIELQGKLEGRRLIIEALTKELAMNRAWSRDAVQMLMVIAGKLKIDLPSELVEAAKAEGFSV